MYCFRSRLPTNSRQVVDSRTPFILDVRSLHFKLKKSIERAHLDDCAVILESQLQSNAKVTPELFQQGWDLGKQIFGGEHRE